MEAEKNGKVKLTFEIGINQPAMELIKTNMDMMSDAMPQLVQNWREGMASKRKEGHDMGMGMVHHGQ